MVVLATMAAGMAAEMHVRVSEADHGLLHRHKRFAFAVVVCILVLGIWRSLLRGRFPAYAAPLYLVLAVDDFALDCYQRKVDSALGRPPTLPRKATVDDT